MAYIGKSPSGTGVRIRYYFTQTSGGATSISGTDDNDKTLSFSDGEYVDVYLNGVSLVAGTDYNTTTANTIGGLSALANGDVVEVVVYDIFTVADTVSQSSGGTFSGAVGFSGGITGDLAVNTSTLKVDAAANRVGINTASPSTANLEIFTGSTTADGLKINRFSSGVYYSTLRMDNHGLAVHVGDGSSISERAAITPNGITFGGDTAAANALDDYEEGTWTVTNKSVASLSITNTQQAYYVKIGRLVFFNFYVTYPSTSDSNTAKLSLPFASGVSTSQGHSYIIGRKEGSASNGFIGQVTNGTDEILFCSNTSSTGFLTNGNLGGEFIIMSGCYRASA